MSATCGDRAARELRRLAWDPVARTVGDARRVHVVPDGVLAQIPFDALVLDDGCWFAEEGPLVALHDGEEELVETRSAPPCARGILLVGDPVFGDGWPALGQTAAEVAALRSTWERGARGDEEVDVLLGAAATERAVRERVAGKRVVHLATHGWFDAPRATSSTSERKEGARGRPVVRTAPVAPAAEDVALDAIETLAPSLRSGVVLTRGDARGSDDGMLTTEEALALDLDGVEWVVLSACESALGELRRGESALGLRRALRNAGAAVVIGSLVPVDDRAARAWTEALYRARWIDGLDTVAAARAANLATLAELSRSRASTAPARWAGFVAVGADRAREAELRESNGRGIAPRRHDAFPSPTIGERR